MNKRLYHYSLSVNIPGMSPGYLFIYFFARAKRRMDLLSTKVRKAVGRADVRENIKNLALAMLFRQNRDVKLAVE